MTLLTRMKANARNVKRRPCAAGPAGPAAQVDLDPDVLARLEYLDDTIFAAIDGNAEALDRSARTWSEAVEELGWETIEESRQQYLRRARSEWQRLRNEAGHPPQKSFAALEIIALLSDEV